MGAVGEVEGGWASGWGKKGEEEYDRVKSPKTQTSRCHLDQGSPVSTVVASERAAGGIAHPVRSPAYPKPSAVSCPERQPSDLVGLPFDCMEKDVKERDRR